MTEDDEVEVRHFADKLEDDEFDAMQSGGDPAERWRAAVTRAALYIVGIAGVVATFMGTLAMVEFWQPIAHGLWFGVFWFGLGIGLLTAGLVITYIASDSAGRSD